MNAKMSSIERQDTGVAVAEEDGAAVLQAWLLQEDAMRRLASSAGSLEASGRDAADLAGERTGLEIVQGMLRGEVPQAPIGTVLSFWLVEASFGHSIFQAVPEPAFANPHRTMHGGWLATLLDSALGCAVRTTLPAGRHYTTSDLHVRFVRAITPATSRVRVEGRVVHVGRQLVAAEARIFDAHGVVYARATAGCVVLTPRR